MVRPIQSPPDWVAIVSMQVQEESLMSADTYASSLVTTGSPVPGSVGFNLLLREAE